MNQDEMIHWLYEQGGPLLRYRVARELMPGLPAQECERLLDTALATTEAQRWLDCLDNSHNIHGSRDTDAENPLAKLLDYGLERSVPDFDRRMQTLLKARWKQWDALVLLPYLVRAGYSDHPRVAETLAQRVELLNQCAQRGNFDFYLTDEEAASVPRPWRGKPIYRHEFGHAAGYALPTCFDFYALAYCPALSYIEHLEQKSERIVAFLSQPRFQSTPGGYGWDRSKRRCYAAGRVFLACAEPVRLVLFLELGARFAAARQSEWFTQGLATIERYRMPQGTYRFPPTLLLERSGNHIYGGAHMGMGENRRQPRALELESTFRMLMIRHRMHGLP